MHQLQCYQVVPGSKCSYSCHEFHDVQVLGEARPAAAPPHLQELLHTAHQLPHLPRLPQALPILLCHTLYV